MQISKIISKMRTMLVKYAGQTALSEVSNREDRDPFKVLIATVLSHRTKDEVTGEAADRLFAVYPDAKSLAKGDLKQISELIKPVGFYNTKARRVREISQILLKQYRGVVPRKMEDLLELPAVGRKTANCVLVYAYREPAIPVDTHVHRISNRLGLVQTKTPDETEEELVRTVERRYWLDVNELFVRFGQTICKPIGPRCAICTLKSECKYYNEVVAPKQIVAPAKEPRKRARQ